MTKDSFPKISIAKLTMKEQQPLLLDPKIAEKFPGLAGQKRPFKVIKGASAQKSFDRVAIVFSGGPAPGVNALVYALLIGLKEIHPKVSLLGFLNGTEGLLKGDFCLIEEKEIEKRINEGGFDFLGTGRKKLKTEEELTAAAAILTQLQIDVLLIVGGDDSNTNAAFLSEWLICHQSKIRVLGLPKTIDADLRAPGLPISFGFDTACSTYSQMIGNLGRDLLSTRKYWHFVRLMGRNASHITLECALRTQPNLALVSEELRMKNISLEALIDHIVDLIVDRAMIGRHYGLLLIPEGIAELYPDFTKWLSAADSYGNMPISHAPVEVMLIALCKTRLHERVPEMKFEAIGHFYGYEGRSAAPSLFDKMYCAYLGYAASIAVKEGLTGVLVTVDPSEPHPHLWTMGAVPLVLLLKREERAGLSMIVIEKELVNLKGAAFARFDRQREGWKLADPYLSPGPYLREGVTFDHYPYLLEGF